MIDIWDTTFDKEFDEAVEALEKQKHGHWIVFPVRDWGCTNCKCSECGEEYFQPKILVGVSYAVCPNCGAEMNNYNKQTSQGHWSMVQKK